MSVASHTNPVIFGPTTLADLAGLDPFELQSLSLGARAPGLTDLNGDLVGRVLAVPALTLNRWRRQAKRRGFFFLFRE